MKKLFYIIIGYLLNFSTSFALDGGIFGNFRSDPEKFSTDGEATVSALKNGDVHIDDIPVMIRGGIDFFIGIAGTIAIIFIIIGAYQIAMGSLSNDRTKGKETIFMAIGGFVLASLAWFIVKIILDNFGNS